MWIRKGPLGRLSVLRRWILFSSLAGATSATCFAEPSPGKEQGPTEKPASLAPANERISWQLPTENRYLFENQPKRFYQPTISRRLISGMFGFTRTSEPEPARIFERFHKGVDIRPLRRDARGEPLDPVRACADGLVVRVNDDEKISDYGKQVIVRHDWGGLPVFTVYAHLGSVAAKVGQVVRAGDELGILGWTGPGLVQSRAHLHLEVVFQINPRFDEWVRAAKPGRLWEPNRHGEWHGLNLMGIDPVPLLQAAHEGTPQNVGGSIGSAAGGIRCACPGAEIPGGLDRLGAGGGKLHGSPIVGDRDDSVGLAVEGAGLGPARGRSGVGGESRPAQRGQVLLPRIGAGRWQGRDAAQPVRPAVHGDDDVCGADRSVGTHECYARASPDARFRTRNRGTASAKPLSARTEAFVMEESGSAEGSLHDERLNN